ncbi:DUF333 domain-containing protein [Aliivibrio sp. SR45-2]|uniref:DUF333 domain-containing protein n=1 Tax=Aliivibrio sp. SR45-2 TaxID=2760931 RepID=UPI0015F7A24F|nr:DUF333 domain-containing protein [Aliivibrio sp. SR45-2]MBB1314582.1 DUF333 domain-containing protein [Aliivibrio sp. SR45-2]
MFKKTCITLGLLLSLAACSSSGTQEPTTAQKANPAAEFCAEHGTYDVESGNCNLNTGEVVNGWEYYRSQKHTMTKPVEKPIGKPNPAATYCIDQLGAYNLDNSTCTLKNGEMVDAWDFFRSNQK